MIDWANISVGVAAIVGLIYVVREMRLIHRDGDKVSTHQTVVLMELTKVLTRVDERVDRLHDDNVAAASALRTADKTRVRKVSTRVRQVK